MLQTFSVLKNAIKLKNSTVVIDNLVFKFHYRATVLILLAGCVLVTSQQYIGEHIKCIGSGDGKKIPEHVLNTFCFFTATYTVVKHLNASYLETGYIAHPGVGPLPAYSNEEIIRHAYYQWVPFVLFIQAILFYLPHLVWKRKEGGRVKILVVGLQLASLAIHDKAYEVQGMKIPSKDDKKKQFRTIKKAFISNLHNQPWSYWLVSCEVLNLFNLIFNIYLTNKFLGQNFLRLGPTVYSKGLESDIDILDEVFPKVTKCDFFKYGPSGSIQKFDALCVMALNIVNEKIYLVLWFWFLLLLIVTIIGLLWRLITILLHARSTKFTSFVFSMACPGKLKFNDVATVSGRSHFADWLFLYYIAKNMDGHVFKELFVSLAEDLDGLHRSTESIEFENDRSTETMENDSDDLLPPKIDIDEVDELRSDVTSL